MTEAAAHVAYYASRARYLAVVGQDVVLVLALGLAAFMGADTADRKSALTGALVFAIPLVLAWGVVTLHFPTRVAWDSQRIAFSAYGRSHAFDWKDVERVRVRRFLVRDRVLVRLAPARAWRGRYWILSGIDGFEALLAELERREQLAPPSASGRTLVS